MDKFVNTFFNNKNSGKTYISRCFFILAIYFLFTFFFHFRHFANFLSNFRRIHLHINLCFHTQHILIPGKERTDNFGKIDFHLDRRASRIF